MAINYSNDYNFSNPFGTFRTEHQEFAIGGKLVTTKVSMADHLSLSDDPQEIKKRLAFNLAEYMIESNLVEFTKIPDLYNNSTTFIARCYVTPNEQVKILRVHSAKK